MSALLFATACGGGSTTAAPRAGVESAGAASPLVGEFETIGGETIDLADYEGQPTLFWFWEPW